MLKKFLIAMGLIFTCVVVGSLILSFNAFSGAPKNEAVAEVITRDLARAWDVNDLKPHCIQIVARQLSSPAAQMQFNKLKPLGSFKRIEQAVQTDFTVSTEEGTTATVVMVVEFENGRANVTMRLKREDNEMKVRAMNVTPIGVPRAAGQHA